jgi:MFS superfamily sulfate permease-like transporter
MHLIPETALGIICIRLGFFLVNNVVIKNIFYRLRPGDIIQVHPTIFLGVG